MAEKKTYEIIKPILVPGGAAIDSKGDDMGGIQSTGTIELDPGGEPTKKWIRCACIKEKGIKAAASKAFGRGDKK